MKQEDFNQLFDDVKNGVIEKKEALGMLGKFVQKNYPMFGFRKKQIFLSSFFIILLG